MSGSAPHQRLGQQGEDAAVEWYESRGFEILERNWRVREGELDVICTDGRVVVFSEVKTRSSQRFGGGVSAVDWRKQKRIRTLARLWLDQQSQRFDELRFDVIDVDGRGHVVPYLDAF